MADKFFLNGTLTTTSHQFSGIWRLTRVMKAAGWNVVAHSDGTTKTSAGTNNNDSWGANADPMNDTYASIATTIAVGSNGASLPQATINVASATSFASSGTISVLTSAGWQNVTYTGTTGTTFTGCSGGTGTMTTGNPVASGASTVNFDSRAPWIVMSGPTTLKFPFTTAPTGTFVRGESVTQATSGATGELLGIVWDSTLVTGWAIVAPRTGTFNGTNIVTGSISSATFTPGSMKTFAREVMFAKSSDNTTNGSIYYICADSSAESTSLFDSLAAQTGCTATVPPGAGGTNNGFPTIAICMRGTGGSVSHTSFHTDTINHTGGLNVACVNATPAAGVSADGSFYCMFGRSDVTNSQSMIGFFRVDNGEPGDVDPYVFYAAQAASFSAFSRTAGSSFGIARYEGWSSFTSGTYYGFKGYAARDGYVTARDVAVPFYGSYLSTTNSLFNPAFIRAQPNFLTLQNHPSTTPPYLRENISLITDGQVSNIRMHKGTVRWICVASAGLLKDTFDNKKWICLGAWANAVSPAIIVGPWDGTTTPI